MLQGRPVALLLPAERRSATTLAGLALLALAACRAGPPEPAPEGGDPVAGFRLARSLGCASCHAGPELVSEPAPRLEHVGARLTPQGIEAALSAGPRMPDCLRRLPKSERVRARDELVHFLVSLGGPLEPAPASIDALTIERGRQLYHSVGCVACHEPFEHAETLARALWNFDEAFEPAPAAPRSPAPRRDPRDLTGIGARTSQAALARTLQDPLAINPAGRMPSLALGAGEAADLAGYLLYEDAVDHGAVLAPGPGLQLDVYEADFSGDTADFDALVPVRSEVATSFFEGIARREDDFGFRFRGLLAIAAEGSYRFSTTSDDGSMLYVDGKLVVDNRGQHPMEEKSGEVHLAAGQHALEVTYFEHLGGDGLEVRWSGPGFERQDLGFEHLSHLEARLGARAEKPFRLDPAKVERGRERYEALGCASCHTRCGEGGRAFAELDPRRGCLEREPDGTSPCFTLTAGERADLVAAVRAGTPPQRTRQERLQDELARLDCGACHARGALAGPSDERRSYFQVASGLDLGDQGRFPPSLERVGAKLKPAWFAAVLEQGGRARPYMKTRMPQFGAANVSELPELFAAVDAPLRDEHEPEFTTEAIEIGKRLAGTKGLGCIQCHEFAGHPSIGIPAVDLAKVHERIWPGWFKELLMDPAAIQMNTRMPSFWVEGKSPVKDVCGGDPSRQVEALWSYLSLGSSMPLPDGLVPLPGEFEVEVYDTPVCVGVFMEGVSPRTVCVGLPERVHYAFDVQNSRLAMAWRGRFLDARGTWYARAGQLEKPAGEDVLEFPPGAALAMLDAPGDPWLTEIGHEAGYRVLGRRFDDAKRPEFEYRVCGVHVVEAIVPTLRAGGGALVRRFRTDQEAPLLFLRAAVGRSIERRADGTWTVEGERTLQVKAPEAAFVVSGEGVAELRVPVAPSTEVEYTW